MEGNTLRDCLHGEAYQAGDYDNETAISSYYHDEDNQNPKLREALRPIVDKAVANTALGPELYSGIKSGWDSIPSIPLVYEKPQVEFPTIEENIADAFCWALSHFMDMYEVKQRANKVPPKSMNGHEEKAFVTPDDMSGFPYAVQVLPEDCETPDELEFNKPEWNIDVGKLFG